MPCARAQLTARWATMSGLATWMTLGANEARSRRIAGVSAIGTRYSSRVGIEKAGTLTRSPVGANAGLSTVGE